MRKGRNLIRKWGIIFLVMFLVLIPMVEITRIVVLYAQIYEFTMPLVWEIVFYWICYIGIIPLLYSKLREDV